MRKSSLILTTISALLFGACSSNGTKTDGGGAGSGGGAGTGAAGAGGSTGGGGSGGGGGGTTGAGGSGGAGGGAAGAGGGGGRAAGGSDGGAAGSGGTAGRAGGDGGTASMNFFVTSRGMTMGGNLGGLAGADAFCKTLATAVSATLGAKTWHAYLSTTAANARDRIGTGPWINAAGVTIANNLTQLHDQLGAGATLTSTWPLNTYTIALDETGAQLPANPLVHDILTGSTTDGMLMAGTNCNDWTSAATTDTAAIGHCNRAGGGTNPSSWNFAHTVGCGPVTAGSDFQAGTVSSGGGRGSIYCFAVP
jgi:hypothetical protein